MTRPEDVNEPVDVCIVVEGCYPFVSGGVSTWLDWLIRNQADLSFGVVALTADERPHQFQYELPPNLAFVEVLPLSRISTKPGMSEPMLDRQQLVDIMCKVLVDGDLEAFRELVELLRTPVRRRPFPWVRKPTQLTYSELLGSRFFWDVMVDCYRRLTPSASFSDFFWAWRNLVGGLFSILTAPVRRARVYHSISTGYAGLFAARATVVTGFPMAITEHGVYTNERRIDLIMADWIADTIETGLGGPDPRRDVRGFWIDCFESYARVAYSAATRITTLYGANQSFQRALGASEAKLEVIPNGIRLETFDKIERSGKNQRPTVALIGRVVPIKDIEALIAASTVIAREFPEVLVLIIGPTDEDPDYFELCKLRVAEFDLGENVRFTGKVNILDYLAVIDVLVLTSISEAQPLVLLEAGAARVPCVATDVGSCREIIEGGPDEAPNLGIAGRVAPPMDSEAIGKAVVELLADDEFRRQCGETLRRRVERYFTSEASAARYADVYSQLMAS